MNIQDIKHLANLSRLHITVEEADAYTKQFDEIVAYVDKIKEIATNEIPQQVRDDSFDVQDKSFDVRDDSNTPANVLREDEVSSCQNPQTIIDEAPSHQENFVKVKKILNQ